MGEAIFRPCALIPVYNHHRVLAATVADLLAADVPVLLVDDGSDTVTKAVLTGLAGQNRVTLLTRSNNGGKGAAIKDGLRHARGLGYTHAVQIDADGQHERADVGRFLDTARRRQDALVCGYPAYDESVPRHRLYGRYATHIWVWINTLSLEIRDSMCGFRVYPVAACCELLDRAAMGNRMEFDAEFIVRWHWADGLLEQLETAVTYPSDGVSHFRLWRDNALISRMHARLFFGMLLRLPRLLGQRRHRHET